MTTSDRPLPWPYPPTGPQLTEPSNPVPTVPPPPPAPPGPPRLALHIGRPPRPARRVRIANAAINVAVRLMPTGAVLLAGGFTPTTLDPASWLIGSIALAGLMSQLTLAGPMRGSRRGRVSSRLRRLRPLAGRRLDPAPAGMSLGWPPG